MLRKRGLVDGKRGETGGGGGEAGAVLRKGVLWPYQGGPSKGGLQRGRQGEQGLVMPAPGDGSEG